MEEILVRLESALEARRPKYLQTLQKGATRGEIEVIESTLGSTLPSDIRTLLQWRNGHPRRELAGSYVGTGEPLWGKYRLLSAQEIDDAVGLYLEMTENEEFSHPEWWKEDYIPFADDQGGDHLVVDGAGQVIDYAHAAPMRIVIAPTLSAFLECVIEALETGARAPEDDHATYLEVFKRRMPGYPQMKFLS